MSASKTTLIGAVLALLFSGLTAAAPASASAPAETLSVSPPGANDWSCKPSADHPYPVVLVPGTFESMAKNWAVMSPYLKDLGYCVYSLNYGTTNGVDATGPIAGSAAELATFVDGVLKATGASKVDLVGHSQGGMMPRYYMGFLGGAKKVHHLVGIAPSNHGTQTLIVPPPEAVGSAAGGAGGPCQACLDQQAGSPFLTELNSIGDTVRGPSYTVISTRYDEVVTPYESQFLAGDASQVTNITVQDKCPLDTIEHDQAPNDPVVQQWVANALAQKSAPAERSFQPVCL